MAAPDTFRPKQPESGKTRFGTMRLGSLREAPSGARTLCLAPIQGEERLGDAITCDPWLEDALAPLVARFAALMFTQDRAHVEPFLQQLRWLALEHGIDHIVLPLWPETSLAEEIIWIASVMGLPDSFVLTQDAATWPHERAAYQLSRFIA